MELVKNYIWIILGSALFAFAFDWAYAPNGIANGGVTGLAQIINFLLPQASVGVLVIIINVPIFLVGWRVLGRHFLVSSLVSMAVSSVLIDVFAVLWDFEPMSDSLLASIFGGVLFGLSLGIIFLQGATTGGSDIVARLAQRKMAWLPMGKIVLGVDLVVILAVAAVFRRLDSALYGMVALYVSSIVIDGVLYGLNTSKVAYIISDQPEAIAEVIRNDLGHSVTYLEGEGGWTGAKKRVILCAFNQKQIVGIKQAVERTDPNAFLIVTNAHEVLGEGFKSYHEQL